MHVIAKLQVCILILLFCLPQYVNGQVDCECSSGEKITVCYYSTNKFCPPDGECRYTLDGNFMVDALRSKLLNPALFGTEGISKCPLTLREVEDVTTVEYLENQECNIMFVGAFTGFSSLSGFSPSSIPLSELSTIKEWSTKCPSNLTIISQVEAELWGYEFEDLNENPNIPDPEFSEYSIFNGAFGKISSFEQGGSFQGIFVDYPNTAYSILARDINAEPTIVLDSITNDIILGDIGIFCGRNAGPVSEGPDIENDSDILACNIFDLGCKISTNSSTYFVNICDGSNYTTSTGQVLTEAGNYVDSLLNIDGCDSLIYTLIEVNPSYQNEELYLGCKGDGFSMEIGSNVYDELNLSGIEHLTSIKGCDSMISVSFIYAEIDTTLLDIKICKDETFEIGGIEYSGNINEYINLTSTKTCDSLIILNLITFESEKIILDSSYDVDLNSSFSFNVPDIDSSQYIWDSDGSLSCNNCPNPEIQTSNSPSYVQLQYVDRNGCFFVSEAEINYWCTPFMPNVISPKSNTSDNRQFGIKSLCELDNYNLQIYDRWGNLMFESTDQNQSWDATHNGQYSQQGVYIYSISYTLNDQLKNVVGTLTVLN